VQDVNPRRPIIFILAAGIIAVAALSFIPYSLNLSSGGFLPYAIPVPPQTEAHTPPKKTRGEPAFDVANWYASRGEEPETHGVLIETIDEQRLYASHNADETFNPASLIKLATSLVALKKLGADYRFQIRVYADGNLDKNGTLQGRLYFIGSDPTFGDIGAQMIAQDLRERGIKSVTEGISVSPEFSFNYSESAEESAARLSKSLRLGDAPQTISGSPAGGRLLLTFNSYRLRDLLLYMNARSSNFVSEKIGLLIGGAAGVQQYLVNELKLPSEQVTIARVSGRERNRMTPRGVVTVIRALEEEAKRQGLELEDIMPVASDDAGTLRRRLAGTGLEGAVVGKTGTLTAEVDGGMASLAGIIYTREVGTIVFAILDQGNRIWDNRQMEDQLLADVVRMYATPRAVTNATRRQLLPTSSLHIEKPVGGDNGPGARG
jgi:D-alanyl-D-alanine carboxypeptidase/D-alanyl-D-alanine-endopeptidase (penicillin-binding protein 4)